MIRFKGLSVFFIILYTGTLVIDYLILRNKQRINTKETYIYFCISAVAIAVFVLYEINIKVPSPSKFIKYAVKLFI